jgi:hypothetical protein
MPMPTTVRDKAVAAAASIDADVYFFNGTIESGRDLTCIENIYKHVGRPRALLLLVTNGGNADAAYKISRYFQEKYESLTVLISGKCKSAGTLIAIGATDLAFTPFGELGPLDIQLTKVDRFDQLQSGLTIQDSLDTLEGRALDRFYKIVRDYMQANNGLLSFSSATKAASDFVTQLYNPVFSRIDPEEVGARARSMRIAADYGKRLAVKWQNLKPDTIKALSETYSSHSFVIDHLEAESLFNRVRLANQEEQALVEALGRGARYELPNSADFVFEALSKRKEPERTEADARVIAGGPPADGGHTTRADSAPEPSPPPSRGRRVRSPNGKPANPPPTGEGS